MKPAFRRVVWLLVALAAGCAGPEQPRYLIDALDAQKLGFNPLWVTDTQVGPQDTLIDVVLFDDVLVLTERPSNTVTAVALKDGSILWKTVVAGKRERLVGLARKEGRLLVNTEAELHHLDLQTGRPLKVDQLEQVVMTGPVVWGDYAIFGGVNGLVYAHDLTAGFAKWRQQLVSSVDYRPVLHAATVLAADRTGVVALLQGDTGEVIWRRQPAESVVGQPAVSPLAFFLPTDDHKLHAVSRTTRFDRWVFSAGVPLNRGPTVLGNLILQPLTSGWWVALDAVAGGKELWRVKAHKAHSVVRVPQGVLLGLADRMILLDPATGKELQQFETQTTRSLLTGPGGSLIVVTPGGRVMRLDAL